MNGITGDNHVGVQTRPELFVAYAESDTEWVHGFLLPEVGLDRRSVLTPQDFRPGAALVTELERAVETARLTVLVVSPAFGMSQWSAFAELLATHDAIRRNPDRLVPVLLEAYELPLHLDFRVRLDCTVRSRWETEVARLRQLLQRGPPPEERLPCPYPGLLAFGPEDAGLFFGRDRESDDISRRIRQQNFLLVVGPSGSGKSSLVSAGVLPRLTAADGVGWMARTLRPDAGALRWLTGLLDGAGASASQDRFRESVDALLHTVPGAGRLLLFFDQAESIFLLPSKEERALFLALLDRLRRVDKCVVLLAMRADFYADLMTSILWPVGRGERVEIAPLRSAALREAITRPAARAGVYLEPVLVERLLRDAGEEPGALSLVQETMVLLWERMTRRLLTVSAYEDLGGQARSGLAAALATRADAALASLSAAQRSIARRIFLRLVQLGEGRQDTRRPQPVGALRASGDDPALFDSTLRHLTDRRLVTVSADSEKPTVDLGHEAMITHWPTLGDWIDESRADELARRRIERDSEEWRRNKRDRGELYRRRKLADALELAARREHELSQNAVRFLAAGRRRRRLGLLSLAVVAIVALGGVVWLAKTPVRDAWLKHEAERFSPQVPLAGGPAIVGPGGRRVRFPSLLVDIHEVSNRQYRYCVEAQQCAPPYELADDAHFAEGDRNLPVVYVTAYDAVQFCSWLGRRLPTEPQWERIARGTDGAAYPWGNAPPKPRQANIILGKLKPRGLVPVSSTAFSSGDSRDGVEQLIGNAREWTATVSGYSPTGTVVLLGNWNGRDRVTGVAVMGGGYLDDAASVPDSPYPFAPSTSDGETGFRCVETA
jgi:formylglycine-generating enzyme required for sulfatase activity/energy-coupling factor transporter ATP-binding protein EcfA2